MDLDKLDINVLLMRGKPSGAERLFAWSISVLLLVTLLMGFLNADFSVDQIFAQESKSGFNDYFSLTLQVLGGVVLVSELYQLLFPRKNPLFSRFRKYSPIGYLENRELKVVNKAYKHVVEFISVSELSHAVKLATYERDIMNFSNLRIITLHKEGKLIKWINSQERLEQVCRFLYLCYLAKSKAEKNKTRNVSDIF